METHALANAADPHEQVVRAHAPEDWRAFVNKMKPFLILELSESVLDNPSCPNTTNAVSALLDILAEPASTDLFPRRTQATSNVTQLLSDDLHCKGSLDLRVILASALFASAQTIVLTCEFN